MTSPTVVERGLPVALQPNANVREALVHGGLLLLTLFTTTAVGMRYMFNFQLGRAPLSSDADLLPYGWMLGNLHRLATGLPFSLTFISILLAHEFGHYFACRRFGVSATLPYMLPAPSLSGTFGAVIRLRSRIQTRAALIVIGASGPIAGFAVALVTLSLGLAWSSYGGTPHAGRVGVPLLLPALHAAFGWAGVQLPPLTELSAPHPVLIASWMGLLITALNLIPAGQLDGGHLVYALSPKVHRWITRGVIAVLLGLGVFAWAGWLLWGVILMTPAMRHPRVPSTERIGVGVASLIPLCLCLLVLCGTAEPFHGYGLLQIVREFRAT